MDAERYQWGTATQTNYILASIYDMLAIINENLKAKGTHTRSKMPKLYPRPHDKEKTTKKIGTAMPAADFDAWIAKKRGERNG